MMSREDQLLKPLVQARYGEAARKGRMEESPCSCGPACCPAGSPISGGIYSLTALEAIPRQLAQASLGCGDPVTAAQLQSGEVVLDLGCGGGLDVLMAAQQVAPQGRAIGLDMTEEMLQLARENQQKAGIPNAEFIKGDIENIPLPARCVDVVISNCVVNLAPSKDRVFAEAWRVLRPGGRMVVADIVRRGHVPDELRQNPELWAACLAGALAEDEYLAGLRAVGFVRTELVPLRLYTPDQLRPIFEAAGFSFSRAGSAPEWSFFSAVIRAFKPFA